MLKVKKDKRNIFDFKYIKLYFSKKTIDGINSYGKVIIQTGECYEFPLCYIHWNYRKYEDDNKEEAIDFLSKVVKNQLYLKELTFKS